MWLSLQHNRIGQNSTIVEERLAELIGYKTTHGHCNTPKILQAETNQLVNGAVGIWFSTTRKSYKKIQERKPSKFALSEDQID